MSSAKRGKKDSTNFFTIGNKQSVASQVDDILLVINRIILTSRKSPSLTTFARHYVLRPTFKNDMFIISFGLPALSDTPRVLDTVPTVRADASNWTYQGTRTAVSRKAMMNVASYNYLGFIDLEYHTRELLEYAVRELPLAGDSEGCNENLEEEMKSELRNFMGFEGCVLTSSGYAINLVAYPAMASSSESDGSFTVFLMDSESHSSMFMGAFIACASGKGRIVKFRHNDMGDLEEKLQEIHGGGLSDTTSKYRVWVTVEGMYSMSGTLCPLPEIVGLKIKWGFKVYLDEAHSFLSIGHSGRGVVDYFSSNDPSSSRCVSMTDVDMIGGTLSKSLASVGGFVLSHDPLTKHIEARITAMKRSSGSSIPTLSMIRTLQILKKPILVSQRLTQLRSISAYVSTALETKGYKICLTEGGPLIAIILDTTDRVLKFLKIGREIGLICCGASYPAAPKGAPRVRLSLTGAHTLEDADDLLQLIDQISITVGVKSLRMSNWSTDKMMKESLLQSGGSTPFNEDDPTEVANAVDNTIRSLCPPSLPNQDEESLAIRDAGITALSRYNLGAAGPRWMYGTFSAHLSLEDLLNNTVTSMVPSASGSKALLTLKSTLFTETRVGIMSIIMAALEGLTPRRAKNGEKHLVFLPESAGLEIREGAAAAQRSSTVQTHWISLDQLSNDQSNDHKSSLTRILAQDTSATNKRHITLYLDTELLISPKGPEISNSKFNNTLASKITSQLAPLASLHCSRIKTKRPLSTTLLINDPYIFTTKFASTQTIISSLNSLFPDMFSSSPTTPIRFLLFGSFHNLPHLPGVQGAFCTGSEHLVEKVQFLGPGVMYTAMMPPLNAVMVEESVKFIVGAAESQGKSGQSSCSGVRDV